MLVIISDVNTVENISVGLVVWSKHGQKMRANIYPSMYHIQTVLVADKKSDYTLGR